MCLSYLVENFFLVILRRRIFLDLEIFFKNDVFKGVPDGIFCAFLGPILEVTQIFFQNWIYDFRQFEIHWWYFQSST